MCRQVSIYVISSDIFIYWHNDKLKIRLKSTIAHSSEMQNKGCRFSLTKIYIQQKLGTGNSSKNMILAFIINVWAKRPIKFMVKYVQYDYL